jgi:hypothetical protein
MQTNLLIENKLKTVIDRLSEISYWLPMVFHYQGINPWLYIIKSVYNLLFLLPIFQVSTNGPALDDHKQKIPFTKKNYFTLN